MAIMLMRMMQDSDTLQYGRLTCAHKLARWPA